MANFNSVLNTIRSQFSEQIRGITPTVHSNHPFVEITQEARNKSKLSEIIKQNRTFEVEDRNWKIIKQDYAGGGVEGYTLSLPVLIGYRDILGWREAAINDYYQIVAALETSVAGDGIRLVHVDDEKIEMTNIDDDFFILTINCRILLEVDRN